MHAVGVDMELVHRFDLDRKENSHFFDKIYTKDELEHCFSKENPAPSLATRFAAKEAIVKALSNLGFESIDYSSIEIEMQNNIPTIRFHDDRFDSLRAQISLSHTKEHAIAMCLCQRQ